jgi:putative tricarboxylic transport membrane protein
MASERGRAGDGGLLRSPQDLAAGLFLLAIAAVGFIGAYELRMGQLTGIGPGMLPKVVSLLVGAFGVLLVVLAFASHGARLAAWNVRGLVLVLGAVLLFALLVRPAGLLVAGPVAVVTASLADSENRLLPTIGFALVLTLLSGLLFKDLLNLPIPFDPMGVTAPLHGPYAALKSALRAAVALVLFRG